MACASRLHAAASMIGAGMTWRQSLIAIVLAT
jgi:hypothetical protein